MPFLSMKQCPHLTLRSEATVLLMTIFTTRISSQRAGRAPFRCACGAPEHRVQQRRSEKTYSPVCCHARPTQPGHGAILHRRMRLPLADGLCRVRLDTCRAQSHTDTTCSGILSRVRRCLLFNCNPKPALPENGLPPHSAPSFLAPDNLPAKSFRRHPLSASVQDAGRPSPLAPYDSRFFLPAEKFPTSAASKKRPAAFDASFFRASPHALPPQEESAILRRSPPSRRAFSSAVPRAGTALLPAVFSGPRRRNGASCRSPRRAFHGLRTATRPFLFLSS